MGKSEEALLASRKALAIFQKLADANAAVTEFQHELALTHYNFGNLLAKTRKPEEAIMAGSDTSGDKETEPRK
jgi:hypothetical protein